MVTNLIQLLNKKQDICKKKLTRLQLQKYPENRIIVPRFHEENGFYTTTKRSKLMSRIKGKDTKPEILLRKELWNRGYRYRKNVTTLPGKPDIVFNKFKLVVFVDGEFWHGYNWEEKKGKIKSNRDFWIPKIERNMQRDRQTNIQLNQNGYTVFRFWEQQIKKDFDACIKQILKHIESFGQ
jgi:DNA mismatch endonuclease (patch repair protein)